MVLIKFYLQVSSLCPQDVSLQWVGIFLRDFLYGFPFILSTIAVCVHCCYTRVELLGQLSGLQALLLLCLLWSPLMSLLRHARSRFVKPQVPGDSALPTSTLVSKFWASTECECPLCPRVKTSQICAQGVVFLFPGLARVGIGEVHSGLSPGTDRADAVCPLEDGLPHRCLLLCLDRSLCVSAQCNVTWLLGLVCKWIYDKVCHYGAWDAVCGLGHPIGPSSPIETAKQVGRQQAPTASQQPRPHGQAVSSRAKQLKNWAGHLLLARHLRLADSGGTWESWRS